MDTDWTKDLTPEEARAVLDALDMSKAPITALDAARPRANVAALALHGVPFRRVGLSISSTDGRAAGVTALLGAAPASKAFSTTVVQKPVAIRCK